MGAGRGAESQQLSLLWHFCLNSHQSVTSLPCSQADWEAHNHPQFATPDGEVLSWKQCNWCSIPWPCHCSFCYLLTPLCLLLWFSSQLVRETPQGQALVFPPIPTFLLIHSVSGLMILNVENGMLGTGLRKGVHTGGALSTPEDWCLSHCTASPTYTSSFSLAFAYFCRVGSFFCPP